MNPLLIVVEINLQPTHLLFENTYYMISGRFLLNAYVCVVFDSVLCKRI